MDMFQLELALDLLLLNSNRPARRDVSQSLSPDSTELPIRAPDIRRLTRSAVQIGVPVGYQVRDVTKP